MQSMKKTKRRKSRKPKFSKAGFGALLTVIHLGSVLCLVSLTGCGSKTVLHPIEGTDIVMVDKGQTFNAPKQGAFLSDEYIQEVMKAKVK